jgi:hypothetical protein
MFIIQVNEGCPLRGLVKNSRLGCKGLKKDKHTSLPHYFFTTAVKSFVSAIPRGKKFLLSLYFAKFLGQEQNFSRQKLRKIYIKNMHGCQARLLVLKTAHFHVRNRLIDKMMDIRIDGQKDV